MELTKKFCNPFYNKQNDSTFDDCPPWFKPSPEYPFKCLCTDTLQSVVSCSDKEMLSYIAIHYCMSYDENTSMVLVGACPYPHLLDYGTNMWSWIPLPTNISLLNRCLCGPLNREGLLCGRCKKGFGISAHLRDLACVDCSKNPHGWVWYALTATFLPTLFFLIVFFFRISVTSDGLNGFIIFCQIVASTNASIWVPSILTSSGYVNLVKTFKYIFIFYDFWVLEFLPSGVLPPACLINEDLSILNAVAIRYISAFYPFFLIFLAYLFIRLRDCNFRPVLIVWKPYQKLKVKLRKYVDLNQSLIHAFSSILVLSYSKLALVSYSLLFRTYIYNDSGVQVFGSRWYYDASVEMFGKEHLPYAVLAIFILGTFVIAPPLLLILYPFKWFRKLLRNLKLDSPVLNTFMDTFQGCFKDGTDKTKDLRYFAGLYFILRLLFISNRLIISYEWQRRMITLLFVIAAILQCFFHPYKREVYNVIDASFFFLMATISYAYSVSLQSSNTRALSMAAVIAMIIVSLVPLIYFVLYLLYHLIASIKSTKKMEQMDFKMSFS